MKKLLIIALCFAQQVFPVNAAPGSLGPMYSHIGEMIDNLHKNCSRSDLKNNYSYELLIKHRNHKKIVDFTEWHMLTQTDWISELNRVECNLALANNTIDGMEHILKTRKEDSFMYASSHLVIGKAFLIRWLYGKNNDSADFNSAMNTVNIYIDKEKNYKTDENFNYYSAIAMLLDIVRLEEFSKNPSLNSITGHRKTLDILEFSIKLAEQGLYLAKNKDELTKEYIAALIIYAEHQNLLNPKQKEALEKLQKLTIEMEYFQAMRVAAVFGSLKDYESMNQWLELSQTKQLAEIENIVKKQNGKRIENYLLPESPCSLIRTEFFYNVPEEQKQLSEKTLNCRTTN